LELLVTLLLNASLSFSEVYG